MTQSPDYILPITACLLQNRAGLSKKSLGFDINLWCSGFVNSLSVALSLINSETVNNCLIVCAKTYSKCIKNDDKINLSMFGDAASVCLLKKGGDFEIGPFEFGIDGQGVQNLTVKGKF